MLGEKLFLQESFVQSDHCIHTFVKCGNKSIILLNMDVCSKYRDNVSARTILLVV